MIGHEKVNILMVDDLPAKLLTYEVMLADLGENLIKATSARQALEQLLKTDVAVVQMEALNSELAHLSNRLITAQDQERRRIARDLHDGLGQELAAAKMMIDGVLMQESYASKNEMAAEAGAIVDRAIQQIRTLSHLLHPPLLDEVGLLSAIQWYLDGLADRGQIETLLEVHPVEL